MTFGFKTDEDGDGYLILRDGVAVLAVSGPRRDWRESYLEDLINAANAHKLDNDYPRPITERKMTDTLKIMKHGHACPIADEHYKWAVAEIDRLRATVQELCRKLDAKSFSDLRVSGGIMHRTTTVDDRSDWPKDGFINDYD